MLCILQISFGTTFDKVSTGLGMQVLMQPDRFLLSTMWNKLFTKLLASYRYLKNSRIKFRG